MIKKILNKKEVIIFEIDNKLYVKASKLLSRIDKPFLLENVFLFFSFVLSKIEKDYFLYTHIKLENGKTSAREYDFFYLVNFLKYNNSSETEKVKVKFDGANNGYSRKNLENDILRLFSLFDVSVGYNSFANAAIVFYILFLEAFSRIDYLSLDASFFLVNETDQKKEIIVLERNDLFNFS